jgi:phosphate transport system protein
MPESNPQPRGPMNSAASAAQGGEKAAERGGGVGVPGAGAISLPGDPRAAAINVGAVPGPGAHNVAIERRLIAIKRRLVSEATYATGMLERSIEAFLLLDTEAAAEVRRRDDKVDREEVAIEQECHQVLALYHPFARDFRVLTFALKVNADVERVADHACSIAKAVPKILTTLPAGAEMPKWPTALRELAERVPMACHALLRAVLDEDAEAARALVASDKTIDQLDRRLFDETVEMMNLDPGNPTLGLMIYRVGRELERVGDLMANVAEDVVYLATGDIIRHKGKQPRQSA